MAFSDFVSSEKSSEDSRRSRFVGSRTAPLAENRAELFANAEPGREPTAEELQARASNSLDNTLRIAQEATGVGASAIQQLDQQSAQIHKNQRTLKEVDGELNKSDQTLKRMEKGLFGWFFSNLTGGNKKKASGAPEEDQSLPPEYAREQLIRFYKKHNPEKLGGTHIEDTLKKYRGQEKKIFALLNKKYPESELFSFDPPGASPAAAAGASPQDQWGAEVCGGSSSASARSQDPSVAALNLGMDELSMDPSVLQLKRANAQLEEERAQEEKLLQISSLVDTLNSQSQQMSRILGDQLTALGEMEDSMTSTTARVKTTTSRVTKLR